MDSRQLWSAWGTQLLRLTLPAFDPASQRVSFGSVALVADVANRDAAVANESILRFGNTVPAWSAAWSVRSDVAGEYALFLDYAAAKSADPALLRARQRTAAAEDVLQPTPFNMPIAAGSTAARLYGPAFALPGFAATWAAWAKVAAGGGTTATIHVDESSLPAPQAMILGETEAMLPEGAALFDLDDLPPFFSFAAELPDMLLADEPAAALQLATSTLTVTFAGLEAVPITPGSWFDAALLDRFRGVVRAAPPFFGPQGTFALLPTHVILGLGGTLDLQLASGAYDAAGALLLEHGVPVRFASFLVGDCPGAVAPTSAAELDDEAKTIHITNLGSGLPLMLAVVSQIL